ncbi:hypothetical protein ACIRJR_25970 [Streptomyces sp. NPDC102402]|uniref:hypothetical protein n=1 Tax=Streptomyces sp. NPDC102402 TaxID=3366169 RepID=UPI00381C5759
MSACHIVVIGGIIVVIGAFVAVVMLIRSTLRRCPYVSPVPRCGACRHARSHHREGRCRYELGDPRWGDDSFGTDWKKITTPEICGCSVRQDA